MVTDAATPDKAIAVSHADFPYPTTTTCLP